MLQAVRVTWALVAMLLLPCTGIGAATADTCGLVFRAEPVKDTFLLHEPVWIRFTAENTCDRPLPHWDLWIDTEHISYDILDENGVSYPHGTITSLSVKIIMDTLRPGEVVERFQSLTPHPGGSAFDTLRHLGYFSGGDWRLAFRWRYEPRDTMKGADRGYLHDTVEIVVVAPQGEDSLAMLTYLRVFDVRPRDSRREERLWGLVHSFPESPYAPEGLRRLCGRESVRPAQDHEQNPELDPLRRLVLSFPDYPGSGPYLHTRARSLKGGSRKRFLRMITDSVPGTLAGRTAQRLLDEGSFTYIPRGWTFSVGIGRLAHTGLAGAFADRQTDAALSLSASRPHGLITALDFGILLSTLSDEPGAFSILRATVGGRVYPLRRQKQRDQVYAHGSGLVILAQRENDDMRTGLGAEAGLGLDIDVNPKRTFFIEFGLSLLTLTREKKLTSNYENFGTVTPAAAGDRRRDLIWPVRLTVGMRVIP